ANGTTFADDLNDWCTGVDIPYNPTYTEVWLLRFDDLNLPAGAKVISAKLTVNAFVANGESNVYLKGNYFAVDWNGDTPVTCAGCTTAAGGYRDRDGSSKPWAALGAAGDGTDLVAGKSFHLPDTGSLASTPAAQSAALDPSIVQQWVDGHSRGLRLLTA